MSGGTPDGCRTAAELTPHPAVVSLRRSLSSALPVAARDWELALVRLVAETAVRCDAAGARPIGHIKALALFSSGGHVRASAVDVSHPPTSARSGDGAACDAGELTLNILVYGVPTAAVAALAEEVLTTVATGAGMRVEAATDPLITSGTKRKPAQ